MSSQLLIEDFVRLILETPDVQELFEHGKDGEPIEAIDELRKVVSERTDILLLQGMLHAVTQYQGTIRQLKAALARANGELASIRKLSPERPSDPREYLKRNQRDKGVRAVPVSKVLPTYQRETEATPEMVRGAARFYRWLRPDDRDRIHADGVTLKE